MQFDTLCVVADEILKFVIAVKILDLYTVIIFVFRSYGMFFFSVISEFETIINYLV